jgi:hypothetical protein
MRKCLILAFLLLAAGCASNRQQPIFTGPTSGEFVELNILTAPVGLDLDGRPGVDGSLFPFGRAPWKY